MNAPSLVELLESAVENGISDASFGLVARVLEFHASTRTVDVQPVTARRLQDGTSEAYPAIYGVPVIYPSGGGASITWPLERGDVVFLSFSDRSIDEWKQRGGDATPQSARNRALSDAVAIAGICPPAQAPAAPTASLLLEYGAGQVVTLELRDGAVHIIADDVRLGSAGASDPVVRQSDLQAAVNALVNLINGHTHPAPGGATGSPAPPLTPPTAGGSSVVRSA